MSAQPQPSVVTELVPLARQNFQQWLDSLPGVEAGLLQDIPQQNDEELLKTRLSTRKVKQFQWVVDCACDHEFIERAQRARRGRGNVDLEGIGLQAALSRRAKKLGCTPRTIQKNAQVYRLILQALENDAFGAPILPVLDEWGYWYAASSTAADPLSAIFHFAHQKSTAKRFRVTDAYRLLVTQGMTRGQSNNEAISKVRDNDRAALMEHYADAKAKLKSILETCPADETAKGIYAPLQDVLDDIEDELSEGFDEDAMTALRAAWDKGAYTEPELVEATKFPIDVVSRLMGRMGAQGEYIKVPGRPVRTWHKSGVFPLPPELRPAAVPNTRRLETRHGAR